MNIDFEKWEDSSYYLKKIAEEYQSMIGNCGLEPLKFGITWNRIHKDGNTEDKSDNNDGSIEDFAKSSKLIRMLRLWELQRHQQL